jgi:hypothetical protein
MKQWRKWHQDRHNLRRQVKHWIVLSSQLGHQLNLPFSFYRAFVQSRAQRGKSNWRTFLNHYRQQMLACDFLTVETLADGQKTSITRKMGADQPSHELVE